MDSKTSIFPASPTTLALFQILLDLIRGILVRDKSFRLVWMHIIFQVLHFRHLFSLRLILLDCEGLSGVMSNLPQDSVLQPVPMVTQGVLGGAELEADRAVVPRRGQVVCLANQGLSFLFLIIYIFYRVELG